MPGAVVASQKGKERANGALHIEPYDYHSGGLRLTRHWRNTWERLQEEP